MLGFSAIDHTDSGIDREELEWNRYFPVRKVAFAYRKDLDPYQADQFWRTKRLLIASQPCVNSSPAEGVRRAHLLI